MSANLLSLRAERGRTLERLTEAFAADLLDYEEFERRVDMAHRAARVEELLALRSDLDDAAAPTPTAETALAIPKATSPAPAARPRQRIVSVFGGTERKGPWQPARLVKTYTIFGGTVLDFREAVLGAGTTELKVRVLFGGLEVIVPPHLAVVADGVAIFGGFEEIDRAPPTSDPDTKVLHITGSVFFGGVSIELRLPGESARDARRRRRSERRPRKRTSSEET